MFKQPMLAEDADLKNLEKLHYPVIAMPKIDGVHGVHPDDRGMFARTMKRFGNRYTSWFFSQEGFRFLNGELAFGDETDEDLCRKTTSATSSHEGEPWLKWHIFDWVEENTLSESYFVRHNKACEHVDKMAQLYPDLFPHVKVIPYVVCEDVHQLLAYESLLLDLNYEGVIVRYCEGGYKQGRSTRKQGFLLRMKRFIEEDAIVVKIIEGETNTNEAEINEVGRVFRSSAKDGKVANGMLGKIICTDVKTGDEIIVGPGKMKHDERKFYFENPCELIGKRIKYKHFPRGVKEKRRFPQFVSLRSNEDTV